MHRFYLPPKECEGAALTLREAEARHAVQVLRLRKEDEVLVLDGAGNEFRCEVQEVSRKSVLLAVRDKKFTPPPESEITLLQAIPKGKIFEDILQKAVELGMARIIPLLSDRVVTRLDAESAKEKAEKWRLTAIEAIKQCGQQWLPRVEQAISPQNFLDNQEAFELPLIGSLQKGSRHPGEYFGKFFEEKKRKPKSVCIWIGPEGDFTPAEIELITSHGVLPITLGRLVLRCETAAIYCLSFVNYELAKPR